MTTDQGRKVDTYSGYRFLVEIDGIKRGGFRECSGLDFSHDPVDYREGSDPGKPPGLIKRASIVLKWGVSDDAELWEWRRKARDGKVVRKNGTIISLTDAGDEEMRWNFTAGWPAQWRGSSPDVQGDAARIEMLEIVYEGLRRA